MNQHRRTGYDLPLAFLGALAVHSVLGYTSLLWSDALYGVNPGPRSLQMELVANTREAEVVAEHAFLVEPVSVEETLADPEEAELTEPPLDEPDAVLPDDPLALRAIPLARLPRRVSEAAAEPAQEVASSPSPSPQPVEANSDIDQAATDQGAEAGPDYLLNTAPKYPEAARRRGIEGVVLLEVLVLANGTAGSVRVAQDSGSSLLDEAALEAVCVWRFKPATRAGVPVDSTVVVPVRFRLQDR